MIKCIVVDDEQSAINILKTYIEQVPFLELAGTFKDPFAALQALPELSADLIFLDIHMPNLSGLEFMKLIDQKYKVVLTTAYSEFALEGFEQNAADYLLKPIKFERFFKSVHRMYNTRYNAPALVPAPTAAPAQDNFIFVKTETKGRMIKIAFSEILYIESFRNYLNFHCNEKEKIVGHLNFGQVESVLPARFVRVHKSFVVNIDEIQAVDGAQIILSNKAIVPIGASYKEAFFDRLQARVLGGRS
jgi:DNA-binding LytR/AlgR family response regulator